LDDTYSSSAHRVATAHSLCLDHGIKLEFTERYQRKKCPSPSRRRLLHSWSQRHKHHTHSTTHIRPQRTGSLSFITHHTSHNILKIEDACVTNRYQYTSCPSPSGRRPPHSWTQRRMQCMCWTTHIRCQRKCLLLQTHISTSTTTAQPNRLSCTKVAYQCTTCPLLSHRRPLHSRSQSRKQCTHSMTRIHLHCTESLQHT
jgi:hypothetical protein